MVSRFGRMTLVALALLAATAFEGQAQSLGTFRFQLQPYCNVVVVNITQNGSVYTVDGYDDLCGATQRASVVGMALLNPDGTVGFGMTIVAAPGGTPTQVYATASPVTGNGSWRDGAGASGSFILTPGASTGGSLRPLPPSGLPDGSVTSAKILDGTVGASDINAAQVQQRVAGACATGQLMTGVNQDGTVACQAVTSSSGGDITAVIAGPGLLGGAASGDATVRVDFGGPGASVNAARADHTHAMTGSENTAVGLDALRNNLSGTSNTAAGAEALRNVTGSRNTGVGDGAGLATSSGSDNTFLGAGAGERNTTGTRNIVIGSNADVAAADLTNATAIGWRAEVAVSNAIVLGAINGTNLSNTDTVVGIGTSSPNAPLDIDSELPLASGRPGIRLTNSGSWSALSTRTNRGTRSAPLATQQNQLLFELATDGHDGTGFSVGGKARINTFAEEDWTSVANGTGMNFFTTANGTTTPVNRMRIDHRGAVGIGVTAPAQRLDVDGNVRIGTGAGTVGCLEARDGTGIAGNCPSDARFKREIQPLPQMLATVSSLRPVTYYWRSDEFPERHFGSTQSFGLIAQEVEALIPDMVTTDAQGYKAVNYSKLPLLTLQAVKELVAENDTLKAQLRDQQGDVATLRAELASMRTLVEQLVAAQR